MLGISLKDHILNTEIRRIILWKPLYGYERTVGRLQKRCLDDTEYKIGGGWSEMAKNRETWRIKGDAYYQGLLKEEEEETGMNHILSILYKEYVQYLKSTSSSSRSAFM